MSAEDSGGTNGRLKQDSDTAICHLFITFASQVLIERILCAGLSWALGVSG